VPLVFGIEWLAALIIVSVMFAANVSMDPFVSRSTFVNLVYVVQFALSILKRGKTSKDTGGSRHEIFTG